MNCFRRQASLNAAGLNDPSQVTALLKIEKFGRGHLLERFDCGQEALNRFLHRFAWSSQQAGASQTYVALADDALVGFYTLVVGAVDSAGAPERLTKGMARHPIPLLILARPGEIGRAS